MSDTAVTQCKHEYRLLKDEQYGTSYWVSPKIFFFITFLIGLKERTKVTTSLLKAGRRPFVAGSLKGPTVGSSIKISNNSNSNNSINASFAMHSLMVIACNLLGLRLLNVLKK